MFFITSILMLSTKLIFYVLFFSASWFIILVQIYLVVTASSLSDTGSPVHAVKGTSPAP